MPNAINPSDRRVLLITGVALIALVAAFVFLTPSAGGQDGGIPSIYSSSPGGARAAFLLLRALHRSVQPWEQAPTELPEDAEDSVLILANPFGSPSKPEQNALMTFVQSGGRILFTGPRIETFFPTAKPSEEESETPTEWKTFRANLPSGYTRHARKIALKTRAKWRATDPSQLTLYGDPDSPAVVSWHVGKGEILWWAGPAPLSNSGIVREGNLNLFLDAVSEPGAEATEQPDVYWDEYFHGERASLWGYFQKTPVPWGLLQLAVLGLAVSFTFGRRSGPIAFPPVLSRLSPLEFVDTLGGLYERAHAEPALVEIAYQRFRMVVTRQLRLPRTTTDAALDQAIRSRLGLKDGEFLDILQRADSARGSHKVAPGETLELIQKLESYEEKLGLKKKE
jgi:Domain of unknown function (DUF4350)